MLKKCQYEARVRNLSFNIRAVEQTVRTIALIFLTFSATCIPIPSVAQTNNTKKGTLVIGILNIESSYAQNKERPSRGVPDTVQFWIGPNGGWRVRTYAIDHDIHPHDFGGFGKMEDRRIEFARDHIKKHYGDVLASTVVLEFPDTSDTNAVRRILAQRKLTGSLEVAKMGFAFWNPDNGDYRSKTEPK